VRDGESIYDVTMDPVSPLPAATTATFGKDFVMRAGTGTSGAYVYPSPPFDDSITADATGTTGTGDTYAVQFVDPAPVRLANGEWLVYAGRGVAVGSSATVSYVVQFHGGEDAVVGWYDAWS
jgi:hypothetical protein